MSAIDAQDTTITFDGTPIGGVLSFEFMNGNPAELLFRAISAPAAIALPGQPDHGFCVLKLYRDGSDPGQQKLQASLRLRQVKQCVITYKDGRTETFDAFCSILPVAGSKAPGQPAIMANCRLRISGQIT